ncbi:MAG: quinoprotein dehydrogenase-associated putative ABC transporter substrate-binding protein [Gammaproteobacteria bacterium]
MRISPPFARLISSLLFCAASGSAFAADTFKVCADPLNPPYSQKDGSGYENKIAALFAKALGQKLEYTWFPDRIGFLRNTLNAQIGDTEEYKCDVAMSVPAHYDRALTTKPYYHSTYVLLIAKKRGWDDIKQAAQLGDLDDARRAKLRIAMFDRGPGTAWLQQNDLLEQGVPYQTLSGDNENNTAMTIAKDFKAGKIDMAIIWGPMAGYVLSQAPKGSYTAMPMVSEPGMKFDFSIAMGVRRGDEARKKQLDALIDKNQAKIDAILRSYGIPLLPIPKSAPRKDDD